MIDTPFLETHHTELAARVDRFNRERQPNDAATEDEQARSLVQQFADASLLDYTVPVDFRSATLDVRALCVAREHLAYDSSLSDLMFAMQGLGSFPVTLAGDEALKRRWLARVKAGAALPAVALTPTAGGSGGFGPQTKGRRGRGEL